MCSEYMTSLPNTIEQCWQDRFFPVPSIQLLLDEFSLETGEGGSTEWRVSLKLIACSDISSAESCSRARVWRSSLIAFPLRLLFAVFWGLQFRLSWMLRSKGDWLSSVFFCSANSNWEAMIFSISWLFQLGCSLGGLSKGLTANEDNNWL